MSSSDHLCKLPLPADVQHQRRVLAPLEQRSAITGIRTEFRTKRICTPVSLKIALGSGHSLHRLTRAAAGVSLRHALAGA